MDEELKNLLERNTILLEETHETVKKISRYIRWAKIFAVVKLVVILIPLIAAALYLPSFFEQIRAIYGGFL
ncbi:MAG: hypothetical protein QY321_03470 [Patescibacteria group bacterium]|nr:MAG: hypothetical protein QY321_03470 [Patescibacteria group bacterium]